MMVDASISQLAQQFLADFEPVHADYVTELAQDIQDNIEDWISGMKASGLLVERTLGTAP